MKSPPRSACFKLYYFSQYCGNCKFVSRCCAGA